MAARIAYRFGEFLVEPATSQFWHAGVRREIDPEALRLLDWLVRHPEMEFTSAELRAQLWPAANFLDGERSLDGAATRPREALGDSLTAPRYFKRFDGGGYRFIHPVRTGSDEPELWLAPAGATMGAGVGVPGRARRFILIAVALQLAVFVAMALLVWRIGTQGR
jgi:DNA-binding winged helix-turn-helix (wHTH) protein